MTFLRKWLPIRRMELAFGVVFIIGLCGLVGLVHEEKMLSLPLALVTLEMLLPLVMGLIAAGLLAGDPILEILLSLRKPAWIVLAERLALIFTISACLGIASLILIQRWEISLPRDSFESVLIWLSPLIFCLGLANATALLRGHILDGVIAVAILMGSSLLALLQIPRLCAADTPCTWWLASPLMTIGNPYGANWLLNRFLWLGIGSGLVVLSFALSLREEPLIPHDINE